MSDKAKFITSCHLCHILFTRSKQLGSAHTPKHKGLYGNETMKMWGSLGVIIEVPSAVTEERYLNVSLLIPSGLCRGMPMYSP